MAMPTATRSLCSLSPPPCSPHALAAFHHPELPTPNQGRRKRQGQKGHFTALLSPQKTKINFLLGKVSTGKFVKNKSVLQQIASFWMSSNKAWSLWPFSFLSLLEFNLHSCIVLELDYLYNNTSFWLFISTQNGTPSSLHIINYLFDT
jgi:hypothetical protein